MRDQIELFSQRGKKEIKDISVLYVLLALLLMLNFIGFVTSSGDELTDINVYIIIISLILLLVLAIFLMRQIRVWRLARDKENFSNEELGRINREAVKGPKFQHVLITHDVIAYHTWTCTRLIPVKDIIWIKEQRLIFLLPGVSYTKTVIIIRTRDRGIHIISKSRMDESSLEYLLNVVKEIRPGVIVGKIGDQLLSVNKNFIELIARVDAAGTKEPGDLELIYDQNNLYSACPSEQEDDRKAESRLILPTVIMYLAAFPLYHYSYYFIRHSDPIKQELLNRIWRTFGVGFFATVPFIAYVIYFFRHTLFEKKRHMPASSKIAYAFFGIIPMGVFIGYNLYASEMIGGSEAITVWKQYEAGTLDVDEFKKSMESRVSEQEGVWRYKNFTYPKHPEVYGYDKLTKNEQRDFDLLYSEITGTTFDLPKKLPYSSYEKVIGLYESNCKYDSFRLYSYTPTSAGEIRNIRMERARGEELIYGEQYRKTAEKIAAEIPSELDDLQKLKWIADYLIDNIEVYQIQDKKDAKKKTKKIQDSEIGNIDLLDTGCGALLLHSAKEKGYMEAYGMIAEKAGIYTIAAMDDSNNHYWNLIQVDGDWKAVNLYEMDLHPDQSEQYYLISNAEMEKRLNAKGTYGLNDWIKLPK